MSQQEFPSETRPFEDHGSEESMDQPETTAGPAEHAEPSRSQTSPPPSGQRPPPSSERRPYSPPPPPPRKDFRPAAPKTVQEAIQDVNQIVETLKAALEDMEELLETLELAERQQEADEQEIETLRRSFRQLHRPRDGGQRH